MAPTRAMEKLNGHPEGRTAPPGLEGHVQVAAHVQERRVAADQERERLPQPLGDQRKSLWIREEVLEMVHRWPRGNIGKRR
jgi:hypothetical protein